MKEFFVILGICLVLFTTALFIAKKLKKKSIPPAQCPICRSFNLTIHKKTTICKSCGYTKRGEKEIVRCSNPDCKHHLMEKTGKEWRCPKCSKTISLRTSGMYKL